MSAEETLDDVVLALQELPTDETPFPLQLSIPFRTGTRRQLIQYAVDTIANTESTDEREWVTTGDLASGDEVDRAHESIRKEWDPLVALGIFEPRSPERDVKIQYYRPGESEITNLLLTIEEQTACQAPSLFPTSADQKTVKWFLESASPQTSYTKTDIRDGADLSWDGATKAPDRLAEQGFLETVDGSRGDEYRLTDGPLPLYLVQLNQLCIKALPA